MSVYSEIKKYLLYLVGFFCLSLAVHLGILYFYSDAETYPIRGGTLNVGIVGKQPVLDILSTDTKIENSSSDTVLRFIYRGVARYSIREKKIVSDLASCGLDTFPTIRCTLLQDALWSDGSSVTVDDILSSYAFFRENARNENTKSRLSFVDAQEDRGDIVFRFRSNDATLIDTLFIPILNKKDIAQFDTTEIGAKLSSGPYIFSGVDEAKGVILLKQNPYFKNTETIQYFDQIRFGFGETKKEVDKNINADILLTDTNEKQSEKHAYTRPLLYGIFLNSTRIPNTLRTAIFNDIFIPLPNETLGGNLFKQENNIFLGEIPVVERKNIDTLFTKAAAGLGYYKGGSIPVKIETTTPINPEKPLKYVSSPGKVTPLFLNTETVEIAGVVPKGTTKVVINDYTLQNFVVSRKQFLYYAKKDFKNLSTGINTYKIIFYAGKKILTEESLIVYYSPNETELGKMKNEWKQTTQLKEPAEIPVVNLDPNKLYKDGKPLSMTIIIQNDVSFFPDITTKIQEKFTSLGVTTEIVSLPLSDIKKNLANPDFSYDIVLTGINLGLFHYNILPFFHSGQMKDGYNISKLRNSSLDNIMERMTEQLYYGSPDKMRNFETNATKILDQEAVFFPLASPYDFIYSKNRVLGLSVPKFISGRESLIDILSKTYLKEGYKLSKDSKTLTGFFVWLKNELFSNL